MGTRHMSVRTSPFSLCVLLFPGNAPVEKLEDFIYTINSALQSLYMEIKKGVTEDDGRPIYALVRARRRPLVAPVGNCSREAPGPVAPVCWVSPPGLRSVLGSG